MRQFVWGMIFGALGMYFYMFHGAEMRGYKDSLDAWRDDAVKETGGYAVPTKPPY